MFRRLVTCVLRTFYAAFHPLKITGGENIPNEGAYILALNHTSFRDAAVALILSGENSIFMAKKELFKLKIPAKFISALGAFPVDRQANDLSALRLSIAGLKEGKPLVIFPEGHRYDDTDTIHEIKQGAALIAMRAGVPIIPARIRTKYRPFERVNISVGAPFTVPRAAGAGALEAATERLKTEMERI